MAAPVRSRGGRPDQSTTTTPETTMTTPPAPPFWEHLVQWQPATAAALTLHLRALPEDWPLRVFGVGRPDAALALRPGAEGEQYPDRAPQIAPYDDIADSEDCPACGEAGGNCRFHTGHAAGHQEARLPVDDALKARPYMPLLEFVQWRAEVAEALDTGLTPPALVGLVLPAPDPAESDEERADRVETERAHAAGDHEYCGVTCEAEFTTEKLRNGILWRAAPGSAAMLDELLRRARTEAAAPSTPADQAERRNRYEDEASPWYEVINPRNATTSIALVHDDGELYLPEGPDALTVEEFHFAAARGKAYRLMRVDEAMAVADAELRRMADEAQQDGHTPEQP
ncbi:hypothetical protein AB0H77_15555 [Streptomyces sp. NPDC050844]|uniref:hypothetical protein n=1 Tax=Streptomyces sp. NPDC050844 TaxID=3155790 RepID=UPI003405FB2E